MKTIVATYQIHETATTVIEALEQQGYPRKNIGFAVAEHSEVTPAEAMVTVTVDESEVQAAMKILTEYAPVELDVRETQWKLGEFGEESHPPDENQYTAPSQKK
jgi:hypothetical protein